MNIWDRIDRVGSAVAVVAFSWAGWTAVSMVWPIDFFLAVFVMLAFTRTVLRHVEIVLFGYRRSIRKGEA